jgi:hypothetical protein
MTAKRRPSRNPYAPTHFGSGVSLTLPLTPRSSEKEMSAHLRESALVLLLLRERLHCESLYTRGVSYAGRCKLNYFFRYQRGQWVLPIN